MLAPWQIVTRRIARTTIEPMTTEPPLEEIGILGGTGPQGRGLARRLAAAGHPVVIGSRSPARADETAAHCRGHRRRRQVTGGSNDDAAAADLVIVTVPYDGHADLLTSLARRWPARSSSTA